MPASKSFQVQLAAGATRLLNLGPLPEGATLVLVTITLPGAATSQGVLVSAALNQTKIQDAADLSSGTRIIDDGDTIVNGQPQWSLQTIAQVLLSMTITPLIRVTAGPRFVCFVIEESTGVNPAALLFEIIYVNEFEQSMLILTPAPSLGAPRRPFQRPGAPGDGMI